MSVRLLTKWLLVACLLWAATVGASQQTIVLLGDSLTARASGPDGYITLLQQRLAQQHGTVALVNAGREGDRVPDMLMRLQADVIAHQPDTVVILGGVNDVWLSQRQQGTGVEDFYHSLDTLVARLQQLQIAVVLCTPVVIGERHDGENYFDNLLEEYVELVRQVAEERQVVLVDLREAFVAELQQRNRDNRSHGVLTLDGVHLNRQGNQLLAEQLLQVLAVDD